MTKRESRPDRGRHPEHLVGAQTATAIIDQAHDKNALTALARRWRLLGLGCPRGCPLDHHEWPCHLAGEVDRSE